MNGAETEVTQVSHKDAHATPEAGGDNNQDRTDFLKHDLKIQNEYYRKCRGLDAYTKKRKTDFRRIKKSLYFFPVFEIRLVIFLLV